MKTTRSNSFPILQLLTTCVLLSLASSSFAASTWSNLGNTNKTPGGTAGATPCTATDNTLGNYITQGLGNVLSCGSQGGVSLNADSFSTSNAASSTTGTIFAAASLYNWGSGAGLGVVNRYEDPGTTGPHATDNEFGTDAIRLTFGSQLNVNSITVGWNGVTNFNARSDLSVLAWTGTGTPGAPNPGASSAAGNYAVTGTTLTGTKITSTVLNGWKLVGNYTNVTGALDISAQSANVYSSYWLVSAYNTGFGSISSGQTSASQISYFKLLGVAGATKLVPEPGSLALMGAALAGMMAVRRRKGQFA